MSSSSRHSSRDFCKLTLANIWRECYRQPPMAAKRCTVSVPGPSSICRSLDVSADMGNDPSQSVVDRCPSHENAPMSNLWRVLAILGVLLWSMSSRAVAQTTPTETATQDPPSLNVSSPPDEAHGAGDQTLAN